ncbi:small conductance mechanosensitive ion channel (MscS) family protein [Hyphomonas adhaerens MHS-3]|uniref:Small conductance mechanosensitive ion channel (MscS) family protein n=1 Tax=Hyphomonas adhaerens MHS-3 TaxID=1280949 RepID=A0A069E647_9PROT|nr:mechanosensitive ion channel family protein [Hyphomonas adhaerens]KCZ85740.1 small conductance mechanosensitive ion channel (MscS) family protein [Hyphomonas adhaerens MHS-3]
MENIAQFQSIGGWFDQNAPQWARDAASYIATIWNQGNYGLTYGEIITAVLIVVIALLVRGLFARIIVSSIMRLTAGTKTRFDDALVNSIATPLKVVPVIIGIYIALQVTDISGEAEVYADRILRSVITLAVFWTLARAVNAFEFLFGTLRNALSSAAVDWMVKALQVLLVVLGLGAVAEQWGIQIAPLLAGLGVLGIAVGLGAQDLFKNLISGILIITEKRFVPGEWIKVDGVVEGTVEKINFRSTLIRRFDKSPVYVPNSALSDAAVTNFSRMTYRRIKWAIGVEYRTTVEQLKYIRDEIEAWLWNDDRFVKPPEAALFVRVDNFNASSIDFLIYTFTHTKNWGEWLAIKEEFAVVVMDIIEKAGTGFAFPSRTIYMQQTDPPEIMAPPARSEGVARAQQMIENTGKRRGIGEADDDG